MKIQVNGEPRDVADGTTIGGLLRKFDINATRVAVEVNLDIVDQQEYERRVLHEGDCVEILSFIGGGTGENRSL